MWTGYDHVVAKVCPGSAAVASMDATKIANAKKLACYALLCVLAAVGWTVQIVIGRRQMVHKYEI